MTGTMRRGTKSHRLLLQTGEGMQRGGGFCLRIDPTLIHKTTQYGLLEIVKDLDEKRSLLRGILVTPPPGQGSQTSGF